MRKGAAILDSLRLAPRFFALGHFRAEGLERTDDGWRLHAEVRGAFHHPLPPSTAAPTAPTPSPTTAASGPRWTSRTARRSTAHCAPKSWSVRSAAERGTSPSTSPARAARAPRPRTLLPPRRHSDRGGLEPVPGSPDTFQLVSGEATYTVGTDHITFGPGNGKGGRQPAVVDAGERYAWLNGSLTPNGVRVLITGRSPLTYRLTLR